MTGATIKGRCKYLFSATALIALVSVLPGSAALASFAETNLVSDGAVSAQQTDANLIDPIGLAYGPSGPLWIAENGTGVASIDGINSSNIVTLNVLPPVTIASGTPGSPGTPTGVAFNTGVASGSFKPGGSSSAAFFLFATSDGTVSGWVNGANSTLAVPATGAVYSGAAIANNGADHLYVANFSQGTVDVFDSSFVKVTLSGNFVDPNLPAGFAPYNVQLLNGHLFITYAQQDATKQHAVTGAGKGVVDEFDLNGNLISRIVSTGGALNAPWGLAIAPLSFGAFGGDLLVANHGSGEVDVYTLGGQFLGTLEGNGGNPLEIAGLWGLLPGNNGNAGTPDEILFSADLGGGHGLLGAITGTAASVAEPASIALLSGALVIVGLGRRRLASRFRAQP